MQDISYEPNAREIKVTKGGAGEQSLVTGLITKWEDLENAKKIRYNNIFNPAGNIIDGQKYVNRDLTPDPNFVVCIVPISDSSTYTIYEKGTATGSTNIVFLNTDKSPIGQGTYTPSGVGGNFPRRRAITTGITSNAKYMAISCNKQQISDVRNGIMVFEGTSVTGSLTDFFPYGKGEDIILNGDNIDIGFNSVGTSLLSSSLIEAVKELGDKVSNTKNGTVVQVNNQDPDDQGRVTIKAEHIQTKRSKTVDDEINEKLDISQLVAVSGGAGDINKVPKLDANGKLDSSFIPDLALTSVTTFANKSDANNAVGTTVQVGDVAIITADNNEVYMCKANSGAGFDDKFVRLHLGNGAIKSVNGKTANGTGAVTIEISDIATLSTQLNEKVHKTNDTTITGGTTNENGKIVKLDGQGKLSDTIMPDAIKNKLSTINSDAGSNGNIVLSIDTNVANTITFKAGQATFGTLSLMTINEAQQLVDGLR